MKTLRRHWLAVRDAVDNERAHAAAHPRLRVEQSDFLPAALEVIERPVSPTARITAWVLLALLAVMLVWLVLGQVDIVASAPGRLVPAEDVKLVQPAEAGVVRAIHVRDGERVRAGQLLVELDPTLSTAEASQATKALAAAEQDAARLRAVLTALDGGPLRLDLPAGTPPETLATQRALAQAQLDQIREGIRTHSADRSAAMAARAEAEIQAAKLTETIPLIDQQVAANERLLEKGYVSKLKVIEMRRQRLAAVRDRDAALAAARRAAAQIGVAGASGAEAAAQARSGVLGDLAKAENEVRLRREEVAKAAQRMRYQRLTSPVDGTVTQMAVHTLGGVVEAAKPVMIVVPAHGPLVAEVMVANRDIGFVAVGQPAAVKLEAFPFTRYGTVPGRIVRISSDAVQDEKQGLVYIVRVALARDSIVRDGTTVPLAPGLAATADIRTGRRSLADYLLSPIEAVRRTAGRER